MQTRPLASKLTYAARPLLERAAERARALECPLHERELLRRRAPALGACRAHDDFSGARAHETLTPVTRERSDRFLRVESPARERFLQAIER